MLEKEFENVWSWILEIGDEILAIYKSDFAVKDKGGNDPVTEADLRASEYLHEKISHHFPGHGFLSEERKDDSLRLEKEWVWILDPIDGTREFVKKNDQFALSLGLSRSGLAIWGVVFNPATGEFFSKKEDVTFHVKLSPPYSTRQNLDQIRQGSRIPSQIFKKNYGDEDRPILSVSLSEKKQGLFDAPFWSEKFEIHAMGSIAYKLGLLSSGHYDLIVSLKPKSEWDICGGIALLGENDFKVYPLLHDSVYKFNQPNTRSYGLVAGKAKAIEYLENLISRNELSNQVKDSW